MNWNIQLFELNFNSKEAKAASDVVKDGWLSMGEKILSFEREFSNFLDIDVYCSAFQVVLLLFTWLYWHST